MRIRRNPLGRSRREFWTEPVAEIIVKSTTENDRTTRR